MRASFLVTLFLAFSPLLRSESTNQQAYLGVFLEIKDGEKLETEKDYLGALVHFKVGLVVLEKLHEKVSGWETTLVLKAMADYREKIAALEPLAIQQIKEREKGPLSSGQPISLLYDNGLKEPDTWKALNDVEEYLTRLEIIHAEDAQWEKKVVEDDKKNSQLQIERLATLAIRPITDRPPGEQTLQQ